MNNNNNSPTILAIDSSTSSCSVSVWKNGAISAYYEETVAAMQSKNLILMVEEALNKSGTEYKELSAVACTIGPGSFTGIRIGLASARGIGLAANIPVLGFSSLEVLAFETKQKRLDTTILAMLNAGKGEIIYQNFNDNMEATCEATLKTATGIEILTPPRADFLAQLAATHPERAVAPLPFYVRPPDAKLPQNVNFA
ncbi:MAG: tRNA (adenosine(37)-N6)-threonylcarbamoyltransferase complex dimerization subunit type 1 TsaB [Rickettsiales bacterium]|jgi:tRNA threonylcarbamoyladenosine biosynthesis protein TsaB